MPHFCHISATFFRPGFLPPLFYKKNRNFFFIRFPLKRLETERAKKKFRLFLFFAVLFGCLAAEIRMAGATSDFHYIWY